MILPPLLAEVYSYLFHQKRFNFATIKINQSINQLID